MYVPLGIHLKRQGPALRVGTFIVRCVLVCHTFSFLVSSDVLVQDEHKPLYTLLALSLEVSLVAILHTHLRFVSLISILLVYLEESCLARLDVCIQFELVPIYGYLHGQYSVSNLGLILPLIACAML